MLKTRRNERNGAWPAVGPALLLGLLLLAVPGVRAAEEEPCLMCHEEFGKKKVMHEALSMGCGACHGAIEVDDVPHKITGKAPKGLSSEQPELCFDCHDKAGFKGQAVHAALEMGCTACHDPHSSNDPKLLRSAIPGLCFECHEQGKFAGATIHPPVEGGDCLGCHLPHAGAEKKLLRAAPPALCFGCHDKADFNKATRHLPAAMGLCGDCHLPHAGGEPALLEKGLNSLCKSCHKEQSDGRHITAGFRKGAHPVAGKPDPSRPGKEMSCASCHAPHSAEASKLLHRRSICGRCHQY